MVTGPRPSPPSRPTSSPPSRRRWRRSRGWSDPMEGDGYLKHYLRPRDRQVPADMDKVTGATMEMQRELPPTPGTDYTAQSGVSARVRAIEETKAAAGERSLPAPPPET